MKPRDPGDNSWIRPSWKVINFPDLTERMRKVEPGQGTDEEEVLSLSCSRSWQSVMTVSGGVTPVKTVESLSSRMEDSLRAMVLEMLSSLSLNVLGVRGD